MGRIYVLVSDSFNTSLVSWVSLLGPFIFHFMFEGNRWKWLPGGIGSFNWENLFVKIPQLYFQILIFSWNYGDFIPYPMETCEYFVPY